ncbi:PIR protein [Plasmodium ovale]|uniref:PIR protein n=1 Tax=Plasmodium ovale TaxID=36330 RepID=A0A1D3JC87_PLAOA|nr:PIR protein [Plasmodium ovale]
MQNKEINIDGLPSNKHKNDLLQNSNFTQLEKERAFDEYPSENYSKLSNFNRELMLGYHKIKRTCSPVADQKCCRDINYYLDLVTIFIEKSEQNKDEKKDLIKYVEDYWKEIFDKRSEYDCCRKLDEASMRMRCILKQLHDYCDDKNVIEKYELQYNAYLNTKWDKIISYTNSNDDYLFYNITYENMNEKVNYKDLLLNTAYFSFINCKDLEKYNIKFSDTKSFSEVKVADAVVRPTFQNVSHRVASEEISRDGVTAMKISRGEDASRDDDARLQRGLESDTQHFTGARPEVEEGTEVSEEAGDVGGVEPSFPLWKTPLSASFSVVGAVFIFFFLYKFSPVGPRISNLIKKDLSGETGLNEDESFLFLNNHKHNDHYISY